MDRRELLKFLMAIPGAAALSKLPSINEEKPEAKIFSGAPSVLDKYKHKDHFHSMKVLEWDEYNNPTLVRYYGEYCDSEVRISGNSVERTFFWHNDGSVIEYPAGWS